MIILAYLCRKISAMEQQIQKITLNEMSEQKMYKIFGLQKVAAMDVLDNWLSYSSIVSNDEKLIANIYQKRLIANIDAWNEQELSLGFIGPILNLVDFKVPYRLNLFAQRSISNQIEEYILHGKPDGILASGFHEPETPFFSFNEYKKEVDSSGDPVGQNLAAMFLGQSLNENKNPVYGCYVMGRHWFFMTLQDKEYAISKAFSGDDDDIYEIVKMLKSLRSLLFKQLGIDESTLELN